MYPILMNWMKKIVIFKQRNLVPLFKVKCEEFPSFYR